MSVPDLSTTGFADLDEARAIIRRSPLVRRPILCRHRRMPCKRCGTGLRWESVTRTLRRHFEWACDLLWPYGELIYGISDRLENEGRLSAGALAAICREEGKRRARARAHEQEGDAAAGDGPRISGPSNLGVGAFGTLSSKRAGIPTAHDGQRGDIRLASCSPAFFDSIACGCGGAGRCAESGSGRRGAGAAADGDLGARESRAVVAGRGGRSGRSPSRSGAHESPTCEPNMRPPQTALTTKGGER